MRHPPSRRSVVTCVVATVATVAVVVGLILVVPQQSTSRASSTRVATAAAASVTPALAGTPSAGDSSTTAPGPASPAPTTAPAAAATGGAAAHPAPAAPTITAAPRPSATTAPTPAPAPAKAPTSSGPAPAAPGTYRYHQAGSLSGTPAEGTLVVAPASASGTQTWTRAVGGTVAPSTSVMRFDANGAYLVSPGSQAAGAASCTFAAPVAWPPWPTTPGQSVSGSATCSGGISSYQVTGHVQATAPVAAAGTTVNAAVVVYTVTLSGTVSGSPFNVTLTETDYYAPTLRVPVLTKTHVSGTAIGIPITTDRTDTLESLTPS
jgi:hypothetical protein